MTRPCCSGQDGLDNAFFVDDERGRNGDAVESRSRRNVFVPNAVGIDRLALRIGEQRIGEFALLREFFEDLDRIVADADHLDAGVFNLLDIALQLDQLPLTEGSPIGRTIEHQGDGDRKKGCQ